MAQGSTAYIHIDCQPLYKPPRKAVLHCVPEKGALLVCPPTIIEVQHDHSVALVRRAVVATAVAMGARDDGVLVASRDRHSAQLRPSSDPPRP